MRAEIITIGDEILIGQTVDTNSAWMGAELNRRGIEVIQISSIRDEANHIKDALEVAFERAQIVLMTGGLGPTQDDITKATLCEVFDTELEQNEEVLNGIKAFFDRIGRPMKAANASQALLPKAAKVMTNRRGTAAGMWFEKEGKVLVSMPGVPYEMKGIMSEEVFPALDKHFALPGRYQKTLMTLGIGESNIAEMISDVEDGLRKDGVKLAYLPSPGMVKLRVSDSGSDLSAIQTRVHHWSDKIEEIVAEFVYGYDDHTIEEVLGGLLAERGESIAFAESCTGGYMSQLLTSVSGSSRYFIGSVVSYDNAVKIDDLGVNPSDIVEQGAVSQPVVEQMARGIQQKYKTTYALATSGVAGPTGGSDAKPVGTVWIGLATPDGVTSKKYMFGGNRQRNIRLSTIQAFDLLRREILKKELVAS